MDRLFIAYKHNQPAIVHINGHRLVVLSPDSDALRSAQSFDSDSIRTVEADAPAELEEVLELLQTDSKCGVVVAPADVDPDELVESLAKELPWIQ